MTTDSDRPDAAASPEPPMIEARGVRKSFGDHVVLDGISFDVARGEVLAIIGPSGSGKSTILRCINFLEPYDAGEIWFDGELIGYRDTSGRRRVTKSEAEIARMRSQLGIVFQSYNLFPHRNVIDNITMSPVNVKGIDRKVAERRGRELLAKVGLEDKAEAYPSRLSGGQQQRVAIARALAMEPKVMLFDEVTSALDPELVEEVLVVMQQLAEEGMTMIIVTHEMSFARDVSDRLMFIDGGQIVEQGDPAEVLHNPRTERLESFLRRFRASAI